MKTGRIKDYLFLLDIMRLVRLIFLIFIPFAGFAFQDIPVQQLNQRLNDFYSSQMPLKVHLFLNQPRYVAGDTIFFKASAVHAATLKRVEKSTILNVVLLNEENRIEVAAKVRLKEGEAYNQIVIPASTGAGKYLMVAYHDRMKNGSPDLYYQHYIDIVGEKEFQVKQDERKLTFYPEGGKLITGASNKVVILGVPGKEGKVREASGKEVASFATDSSGLGFFYLKPEENRIYQAEVQEGSVKVALPASVKEGVSVLATLEDNGSKVRVIIQKPPGDAYREVKLVADLQRDIYYSAEVTIEGEYASAIIPLGDVPGGISRLTVFSEDGAVLAERLFFIPNIPQVNAGLNFAKKEFSTREKITLTVKVTDEDGQPVKGKLSLTAFNETSSDPESKTILNNLYLLSDLKGTATNPAFGWEGNQWKKLDQFLITRQWERAPWKDVLEKKELNIPYTYIRFTGQTVNEKTGEAYTDSTFITFFLQKNVMTYQTFSSKGRFDFSLFLDFSGKDEVFYRIEKNGKKLENVSIVLNEYPAFKYAGVPVATTQKPDALYQQTLRHKLINRSFGFYGRDNDYKKVPEANALLEEEIFGPDVTIDLDKYVLFPTMEETIREIIPMVQHRRIRNESVVRIYFADMDRMATENPLYIIDGVMTDDTNYFMDLKPADVSKVKVIHSRDKLDTFGEMGRGGIILVDTKIPGHGVTIPRSKNSFRVQGLSEPVAVRPFDPAMLSSRVPDLRTNLIWAPEIITDENGEATIHFYTSDVTGEFRVQLEGMTLRGEPFYREETIKVAFKPFSN
jgi:hypothetical protein